MNETAIRKLVQEELATGRYGKRFGLNNIPYHTHNGISSPKINSRDVTQGLNSTGKKKFTETGTYTFNVGFTPSFVRFYGRAFNGGGNWSVFMFGQAALGRNLYSAQQDNDIITVKNTAYSLVQSCGFFALDYDSVSGSTQNYVNTEVGELFHAERTSDGTVFVSGMVTGYGQNSFTVDLSTLASGWTVEGNYFVS